MIDATHLKAHRLKPGKRGGSTPARARPRGGMNSKPHAVGHVRFCGGGVLSCASACSTSNDMFLSFVQTPRARSPSSLSSLSAIQSRTS